MNLKEALTQYGKMLNTLTISHIDNVLDDSFTYQSQCVLSSIDSKDEFLDYMQSKLTSMIENRFLPYAELGEITAFCLEQPCLIVAQGTKDNLQVLILGKMNNGKLSRIDVCIVPTPQSATRTGIYPV